VVLISIEATFEVLNFPAIWEIIDNK